MTSALAQQLFGGFLLSMFLTFVLMLLRVLLRRQWLAAAALILLLGSSGIGSPHPVIAVGSGILVTSLFAANLLRFGGLLTTIVFLFVGNILVSFPLTTDFSAWYAGSTVFAVVVVLALAGYAFHTAVAGRPLFKAGFLESD